MQTEKFSGGAVANESWQMPVNNLERKDADSVAKDKFAAACIKAVGPCFGINLDMEMEHLLTTIRK